MHYNKPGAGAGTTPHVINFNTQTLEQMQTMQGDKATVVSKDAVVFRRPMRFIMSSGILVANPGSETGELLIGYPFSAVSTSQSTEQMTIKLRCYLGAGLYRPENVLILNNIAFEGLDYDDACVKPSNFMVVNPDNCFKTSDGTAMEGKDEAVAKLKELLTNPVVDMTEVGAHISTNGGVRGDLAEAFDDKMNYKENPTFMRRIYRGFSAENASGTTVHTTNAGHLGEVDSLEHCNKVWGTAGGQIYKQRTIPMKLSSPST